MVKVLIKKATNPYGASLVNARASLKTPSQLRNTASQQTKAQIAASLGGVTAASNIEQRGYTDLASRAAGIAAALGSFGPGYGQADFNAFNDAAKTVGSLGTGLVGAVASDWQGEQAANQAAIDKTLGPGTGQVASYDPAAMRSALQYSGVTMPGSGLAQQALTARSMGEYGAQADKAQVAIISQNAIADAKKALDARAQERAAIVAKQPELYQTALAAQQADNARTQTHIDNLVGASQAWLQNQQTLATAKTKAAHDWWLQRVAATHIDPNTGQPVGGWTWTDKTHTGVIAIPTKVQLGQSGRRLGQTDRQLGQTDRQLNITEQHYKDMFTAAQRANNLKAQSLNRPGKFDRYMSGAVGYISDAYGHPVVTQNRQPVPYKPPGAKPKPMDEKTKVMLQGTMASYADVLKNGYTDPKSGVQTQKPVDIKQAISNFMVRGYLSGPLYQWGMTALSQTYGLAPEQIVQVSRGIDPSTGGAYGAEAGDYNVQPSAGTTYASGTPRKTARWSRAADPVAQGWVGGGGLILTQSGHWVDAQTGKYVS